MSEQREQRNEIFKGAAGVDPRIPQTTTQAQAKQDFGLEIPVETVPLPSNGATYPVDSPLHGLETVEIRAMTAREEDILTSKALLKKGTVITELIKSCLIDKRIDPRDLLIGDRNALMVAVRITGYGAEYDAEIECPECQTKAPHQFNLAALPLRRLEIEPVAEGMNLFEFTLPYSKKTVRFRFLSGRDEEEMLSTAEKQKKLGLSTEAGVTTNLLYSIVSIDGVEDRAKIAAFVRMMPARDSLALRNYIRDNEPGIVMKQETSCPSCGHSEEVGMPLGVTFLWPAAK
jgi:hypothetical protein